jgi:WD40 repeat protein
VTAHGYSLYHINVWSYPKLQHPVATLNAHTNRVTELHLSPDGQTVMSGSGGDETLRFWKVFPQAPAKTGETFRKPLLIR